MIMQFLASGSLNSAVNLGEIKGLLPAVKARLKSLNGDMRLFMPPL